MLPNEIGSGVTGLLASEWWWACAGTGLFIISSIFGPPVFRKRHTRNTKLWTKIIDASPGVFGLSIFPKRGD